jgi:hypothetical protein
MRLKCLLSIPLERIINALFAERRSQKVIGIGVTTKKVAMTERSGTLKSTPTASYTKILIQLLDGDEA